MTSGVYLDSVYREGVADNVIGRAGLFHGSSESFSLVPTEGEHLAMIPMFGQSESIGSLAQPALSTTAVHSGNVLMLTPGVRTHIDSDPAIANYNTQLRANLLTSLVDLVEADRDILGDSFGETLAFGLCNGLRDDFDKDKLTSSALGRGAFAYDELKIGTYFFGNQIAAMLRSAQLSADPLGVPACVIYHGVADASDGTSQAQYTANLREWRSTLSKYAQTSLGQTFAPKALMVQLSQFFSANEGRPIAAAYLDAHWKDPDCIYCTPGYFGVLPDSTSPTQSASANLGSVYATGFADGTHRTAEGSRFLGELCAYVYGRVVRGEATGGLLPASATISGNDIVITTENGVGGLAIDTTQVASQTNSGFEISDTSGRSISSVSVSGNDITITLDGTPDADTVVRYAWSQSGNLAGPEVGARGNIRDNTTETGRSGQALRQWLAHFEITLSSGTWTPPTEEAATTLVDQSINSSLTANEQAYVKNSLGFDWWFSADQTYANGDGTWNCKGRDVSRFEQDTAGNRPTYASSPIDKYTFDGSDFVDVTGDTAPLCDFTFAAVVEFAGGGGSKGLFGSQVDVNGYNISVYENGSRVSVRTDAGTTQGTTLLSITSGTPTVFIACYHAANRTMRVYINDNAVVETTSFVPVNVNPNFRIGSTSFIGNFDGSIAELMCFHRDLSTDFATEFATLKSDLLTKAGL